MFEDDLGFAGPAFDGIEGQAICELLVGDGKGVIAAEQILGCRSVPRADRIVSQGPVSVGHKVAIDPVDVVVGNAAAAPGPGSAAQRSADGDLHGGVAIGIDDLCARSVCCCRVDLVASRFKDEDFVSEAIELQGEGHANRTGANDTEVPHPVLGEMLFNHGDSQRGTRGVSAGGNETLRGVLFRSGPRMGMAKMGAT